MILFLTHEKDFFAKQCYLMLKYQHQVPTRWLSWQSFQKQSQCFTLGLNGVFNPILPEPNQIDVLYINLNGLSEGMAVKAYDNKYQLNSWLGFLMWYANQVNCCINPLKHTFFSPGVWTKDSIKRHALVVGLKTRKSLKTQKMIVYSILGNQIETDNKTDLQALGHRKIDACFKLLNRLELKFGQFHFDETLALCRFSPFIQSQISVPVIIKACRYMLTHLSNNGFQYMHSLENVDGWTIASSLRPKMIG